MLVGGRSRPWWSTGFSNAMWILWFLVILSLFLATSTSKPHCNEACVLTASWIFLGLVYFLLGYFFWSSSFDHSKNVFAVDQNLLLSVRNSSDLFFRDPLTTEWFLNSIYSGLTRLTDARDADGKWFQLYAVAGKKCISVEYYVTVWRHR